jgi:hypothetical protein
MLIETKWFSALDLKNGYQQVFSTGQGLWMFTVIPFGLCSTPKTIVWLIEFMLLGLTMPALCTWMMWSLLARQSRNSLTTCGRYFTCSKGPTSDWTLRQEGEQGVLEKERCVPIKLCCC